MHKTLNTVSNVEIGERFSNYLVIETIKQLGDLVFSQDHSFVTTDQYGKDMLEVVGASVSFPDITEETFIHIEGKEKSLSRYGYRFHREGMKTFLDLVVSKKMVDFRSYKSEFYIDGFNKAFKLGFEFTENNNFFSTRQASIDFGLGINNNPHCIENVQFVARKVSNVNHLYVHTTLRSCNLKENFLHDVYLIHKLSQVYIGGRKIKANDDSDFKVTLSFSIGSLHAYL